MIDTLLKNEAKAEKSKILNQLGLSREQYAVLTLYRPSNVDDTVVFECIIDALEVIQQDIPVIFPIHPRTRNNLSRTALGEKANNLKGLKLLEPLGYLDFLKLMSSAKLVLTDSGGIQEETTILKIPCITLRENTERPVTVERGSNRVVGTEKHSIIEAYEQAIDSSLQKFQQLPPFWDGLAAQRIVGKLCEVYSVCEANLSSISR